MSVALFPTLDVVIPCYNEEAELHQCLDALLLQADDIEHIIVVDNNSTDASADILAKYAEQSRKVVVLTETKQGVEYARDAGIAKSRADIIARIDVDTRVRAGWVRALRRYYADHPDVVAGTGATQYYDLPWRHVTNAMTWFFMTMSNELIAGSVNMYGANMSIRREVWPQVVKQLPGRDEKVMEDLAISLTLERLHLKLGYIPDAGADVSGRRIRTSPREFARYNAQWPNTYHIMGYPRKARLVKPVSYLGNILQALCAYGLQYHDPVMMRFTFPKKAVPYEQRELP